MTAGTLRRTVLAVALLGALLAGEHAFLAPARSIEGAIAESTSSGTIDWNALRQEIDGFGASGAFWQAQRLMNFPAEDRRRILDLLFCRDQIPLEAAALDGDGSPVCQSPGIGASMIRNQIKTRCSLPELYCWEADVDQIWLMREAQLRGRMRFFSTPWSAPGWMKKNFSNVNGGEVDPKFYTAYANFLADYVLGYKRQLGLEIEAVSVANEPEVTAGYDSMNWSGEQFRTFVRDHVRPVFELKGVPAKVMLPESVMWSENKALPTLNDPAAEPRLDIVASHGYNSFDPQPFKRAREKGKRVWETEDSNLEHGEVPNDPSIANAVDWAAKIHKYLTQAEVNAWNYWWFVTEKVSGEALVNLDVANSTYLVNKRMYAMGNFSRFVRPGWRRIGTTAPESKTMLTSSYRNPATGEFAIVTVNRGSTDQPLDLGFNGFRADSVVPYTTSATQGLEPGVPLSTPDGRLVATVPPKSVTTFAGWGSATSPLNIEARDGTVWSGLTGSTELTVENVGTEPVSAIVSSSGSDGLEVSPRALDVSLAPGQTEKVPVTLSVAATEAAVAEYRLDASAHVTGDLASAVRSRGLVRYFTTFVEFCPNTALEKVWMHDSDAAVVQDWVLARCAGNPRYADSSASTTYRFEFPADTVGGALTLDIGNQFLVETSTDLAAWRTVLKETDTTDDARNLKNKEKRALEVNELRAGGHVLYVRIGDSQPADGWGAFWTSVRLDVQRASFSAPDATGEGSIYPLSIGGADPNTGYRFAFDCGGGYDPFGPNRSTTCTAGDNGTANVGAKLHSSSGAVAEYRRSIRVDNVAPIVAPPEVRADRSGTKAVASATFSDPGPADGPFACEVDYGDGSAAEPGVISGWTCTGQVHRYRGRGTFVVTIAVRDKDSGVGIASEPYQLH